MKIPDFQDVLLARRQIRPYLPRTLLHSYLAKVSGDLHNTQPKNRQRPLANDTLP